MRSVRLVMSFMGNREGVLSLDYSMQEPPPPANPTASCLWHDRVGRFLGFTENQNNPYETANLLNKNKGATVLFCQRKLKIKTFLRTAKPTKRRLPASNPDETTYWLLFKI